MLRLRCSIERDTLWRNVLKSQHDDIAASELAVDGEVEHREIAVLALELQLAADRSPDHRRQCCRQLRDAPILARADDGVNRATERRTTPPPMTLTMHPSCVATPRSSGIGPSALRACPLRQPP
jgi:hypothetical protein